MTLASFCCPLTRSVIEVLACTFSAPSCALPLQEDILNEAAANGGRLLVTREAEAGQGVAARQVVEAYEPIAGPEAVQTPKQVGRLQPGPMMLACGAAACSRTTMAGPLAAALLAHLDPRAGPNSTDSTGAACLQQAYNISSASSAPVSAPSCYTNLHSPPVWCPAQVYEALVAEGYRVTYVRIPLTDGACPLARDFDAFYSSAAAAGPSDALIYTCQVWCDALPGRLL